MFESNKEGKGGRGEGGKGGKGEGSGGGDFQYTAKGENHSSLEYLRIAIFVLNKI